MRMLALPAAIAMLALSASASFAGTNQDLAQARISSIAAGDLRAVASGYAGSATLHWVGGPLDGTYSKPAAIKAIWTKFFHAQGNQAATIASTSEAASPKGSTVTTDVTFAGKSTVKDRYVLVSRDGKVTEEIWQVNPPASY